MIEREREREREEKRKLGAKDDDDKKPIARMGFFVGGGINLEFCYCTVSRMTQAEENYGEAPPEGESLRNCCGPPQTVACSLNLSACIVWRLMGSGIQDSWLALEETRFPYKPLNNIHCIIPLLNDIEFFFFL